MSYTRIQARVIDQTIQLTNVPRIASGGLNEVRVDFTFCGLWDGKAKTAVFYRDPKEAFHVLLVDNSAVVPAEVLSSEGLFYFGVFGTSEDQVRTTETISMTIVKGAVTFQSIEPGEPTPDIYRQLLDAYGKTEKAVAVERARIDEMVAMRGTGEEVYEFEYAEVTGTIYSTGAAAHIVFEFKANPFPINNERILPCIPRRFAPLSTVSMKSIHGPILYASITPFSESHHDEYAEITITNPYNGEDILDEIVEFEATYDLGSVFIAELADLRVGDNGETYPTAGEAVRRQIKALKDFARGGTVLTDCGIPTEETPGNVGNLYMDTDTGELYKCVESIEGEQLWRPVLKYNEEIQLMISDDKTVSRASIGGIVVDLEDLYKVALEKHVRFICAVLSYYNLVWLHLVKDYPEDGYMTFEATVEGRLHRVYMGGSSTTYMVEDIGGSADILPTVSVADAGKFLRVSADGEWQAQTVVNAEEVAF